MQAGARAVQETKRMTADDLSEIEQVICRVYGIVYCVVREMLQSPRIPPFSTNIIHAYLFWYDSSYLQAHSRIFSLEEELVSLRRKAHVEQANEVKK